MTVEFTSLTRSTRMFLETRNKHAPIKKNILAQTLRQTLLFHKAYEAIILRSRLRNSFLKEKYLKSKKAYNKQRNNCVKNFINKERTFSKKLTYQKLRTARSFGKL